MGISIHRLLDARLDAAPVAQFWSHAVEPFATNHLQRSTCPSAKLRLAALVVAVGGQIPPSLEPSQSISVPGDSKLFQVVEAGNDQGPALGLGQSRQQQCREDSNDGDEDQQFDARKTTVRFAGAIANRALGAESDSPDVAPSGASLNGRATVWNCIRPGTILKPALRPGRCLPGPP
jgi:hypothetical protein